MTKGILTGDPIKSLPGVCWSKTSNHSPHAESIIVSIQRNRNFNLHIFFLFGIVKNMQFQTKICIVIVYFCFFLPFILVTKALSPLLWQTMTTVSFHFFALITKKTHYFFIADQHVLIKRSFMLLYFYKLL